MSRRAKELLFRFWPELSPEDLKDPIEFVRENANCYLRKLRKQGKDVPIFMIKGTMQKPYIITSDDEKVSN